MAKPPPPHHRKAERRGPAEDRRQAPADRRGSDRRRGERRAVERREMWCGVCRTQLTPQGYCPTCRVRVIRLRP